MTINTAAPAIQDDSAARRPLLGSEAPPLRVEELWGMAQRFAGWLASSGYASYDPYDIWGTGYGKFARRLYYQKHWSGAALTAPLLLMEILFPRLRPLLVKKDRYPTADAQVALAFLNLHAAELASISAGARDGAQAGAWLAKAKALAAELLTHSVPGYKGFCWGYPFDWQNVNGLMPKGTPHITATPYCYEVFTRLFELTGEQSYLEIARSIVSFVFEDLKDTPSGKHSAASSYTPNDRGKVVNASAYRAFVLVDAARRFDKPEYLEKARKNVNFILESQEQDGSWLYAIDNPAEAFIDHFHTCFVLKNLYKLNRYEQSREVSQAIEKGYAWYRKALFDATGSPKSYAIAPRLQIVRLEMYNVAEAISLGVLLRDDIPEAFDTAKSVFARLLRSHQLPAGYWTTRVYTGGIRHTVPFLRWPQAQLFLALTNLIAAVSPRQSAQHG
jgi:hypothetical protein